MRTFSFSQDPVFTQFQSSPININPAFAGNSSLPVFHLNSRIEWPLIDFAYNTISFSADQFIKKNNFGFGLLFLMDDSGNGIYRRFRSEGTIAYRLKVKENNFFKLGLSLAYGQNTLDWNKLTFGDMIDLRYGFTLPDGSKLVTEEIQPNDLTKGYLDLSAGLLFYSQKFFAGLAVKHANTPINYYFQNENDNVNRGLPVRFSAQAGGELKIFSDNIYVKRFYSPILIYVYQSGLHQLTFNNYIDLNGIFGGLGYRYNFSNSDALLFTIGVEKEFLKIAYSFDYTVSKLGINTGGSHEIGISINLENSSIRKKEFRYSDCFNLFR